ncbi:hypothetical protein Q8W71_31330 [Methylobacterium sp. NEAU 140]|uniref:hypothetical protein n=1 Tax=Methylobacterium sp. NEAU 140 TaxID=3064945 RepID=UPI00273314F5|nr:hypothetical protein [Methylobacterium sp. NEAU 140]MDP4027084.1 hypothetical protein [Methylobacterium sp. NEAU 140]
MPDPVGEQEDRMRRTLLLATALMIAAPTVARALDPGMIAQGQVLSGMARGYAERGYAERRGIRSRRAEPSEARTRQTCANGREMVRRGSPDPRLRHLLALCRRGGW